MSIEREENIKNVFKYEGSLVGKRIVIIDDIITTGATLKECIKELINAGAEDVYIIVLGVNQLGKIYWSSDKPIIPCSECGSKMYLNVNSNNLNFFYSCYECHKCTLNFKVGQKLIQEKVNNQHI